MKVAIVDAGGCVGHAEGNCLFASKPGGCKFGHFSAAEIQRIAREVTARKKSAVALVAEGKKDSLKDKAQSQGKSAPAMTAASEGAAAGESSRYGREES